MIEKKTIETENDEMNHRQSHSGKLYKRTVCVLLALLMLCGSATAVFAADTEDSEKKNETPIIFVAGFVSTDTVDKDTGEALFPPTKKTIKKAVKDAVTPVLKSALKGESGGSTIR